MATTTCSAPAAISPEERRRRSWTRRRWEPIFRAGRVSLSNGDLAELLWRAGDEETTNRRRALHQASRAARFWGEEARDLAVAGS